MKLKHPVLFLLPLLALPCLAGAGAAPHPSRARLKACKIPTLGKDVDALCGTLEVWENRTAKAGRRIGLAVVVLPALSRRPQPDPIFFLAGGPGQAATEVAGGLARDALRRERDFVFVDQRGTGKSNPLQCDLGGSEEDLQGALDEMFPLDAVRRCREQLEKVADLTLYTTEIAMDDLDEVRAWLGYGRINLAGGSYGTRAAQVYLRRHPQSVRAAVLTGVVPMDETLPISHAAAGQRSLDLLAGWCEGDAACHGRFPRLREELAEVLDRLARGPVAVEIRHPRTGKPVQARLSRELVADGIRWMLYDPANSARLPLRIHQAAAGAPSTSWSPTAATAATIPAREDPAGVPRARFRRGARYLLREPDRVDPLRARAAEGRGGEVERPTLARARGRLVYPFPSQRGLSCTSGFSIPFPFQDQEEQA